MAERLDQIEANETLPRRVVTVLARKIESGSFAPGSRMPTEQQLAQQLGVSRNVIREAIAQLRADGMVEARQGIGAFVLPPEQRSAIRIDHESLKTAGNMARLFELRCLLETEAARLAAKRRTQKQLGQIKRHLERMRGAERWEDGSIEADLSFHRAIAEATGNSYIHTFISFVCEQIRQTIYLARRNHPIHNLVEVNIAEHVAVYDALAASDVDAAGVAMGRHIIGAAERVGVLIDPGLSRRKGR
ncbi:MAG: FadR family transcriptional regulator [Proteobacteria bacterium]|nr:FadR family transcriptional regulator [Pseudomonadota bacterium]